MNEEPEEYIYNVPIYEWYTLTDCERHEMKEDYWKSQKCSKCGISRAMCKDECLPKIKMTSTRGKRPTDGNKSDRWFITVNAKPDVDPIKFWKRAEKFVTMQKAKIVCSLEQRGIDTLHGWHIHFLVEYGKEQFKSKMIQVFENAFTDYIGSSNSVDVRIGKDFHIGYIKGNKVDEKMEKVELDTKFKNENNIALFLEKI